MDGDFGGIIALCQNHRVFIDAWMILLLHKSPPHKVCNYVKREHVNVERVIVLVFLTDVGMCSLYLII
jgi:hypothetical protein